MTTLVVLQPGYLPWLGFFDQMNRADIFVYYDDVQFDKHGWRNRNRVKSSKGPVWLTVPVIHSGLGTQPINQVAVDNRQKWARKHLETVRQLYARAPFAKRYLPELEEVLIGREWQLLVDLDLAVTALMCRWIGLDRRIERSSCLEIDGSKSSRLLNLARHCGADRYLSGDSAQDYLDGPLFGGAGVAVEWQDYTHPVYAQQHGEFVPYLSALDLILNVGPDSLEVIASGAPPSARHRLVKD